VGEEGGDFGSVQDGLLTRNIFVMVRHWRRKVGSEKAYSESVVEN
jgi:hypothetical protein